MVGKAASAVMVLGSLGLIFLKLGDLLQASWLMTGMIVFLSLLLAVVALMIGRYYPDYKYTRYILIFCGFLLVLAVNIAVAKPLINGNLWFILAIFTLLYYDIYLTIITCILSGTAVALYFIISGKTTALANPWGKL